MADGKLGVAVCGAGWCASQHIATLVQLSTTVTGYALATRNTI
jgi:hypothetical protein